MPLRRTQAKYAHNRIAGKCAAWLNPGRMKRIFTNTFAGLLRAIERVLRWCFPHAAVMLLPAGRYPCARPKPARARLRLLIDRIHLNIAKILRIPTFNLTQRPMIPTVPEATPLTDLLWSHLPNTAEDSLVPFLSAEDKSRLKTSPPWEKRRLLLSLGLHYQPEIFQKTGLVAQDPPQAIHAMTRGRYALGGSTYHADLIWSSLQKANVETQQFKKALDFGCSSGRIVRVLQAAQPHIQWSGCDPNSSAIEWAKNRFPQIYFFTSPQEPPLPVDADSLDFVFAISIWSHFDQTAAVQWFQEMRRVLKTGGILLFTTHGMQSLAYYKHTGDRPATQLLDTHNAMYQSGYWFINEFGKSGDWGVSHPEWGTAFVSSEWWLQKLHPDWSVIHFAPGAVARNQDLIIIQKRQGNTTVGSLPKLA